MTASEVFRLEVEDIFHIPGQPTVLAGVVSSGTISVGAKLDAKSPTASTTVRLEGLEDLGTRELRSSAGKGDHVAAMVSGFDPAAHSSGVERTETGWAVLSLEIRTRAKRSWWSR